MGIIVLGIIILSVAFIFQNFWEFLIWAIIGAIIAIVVEIRNKKENEGRLCSVDLSQIDAMNGFEFEQYVAYVLRKNGYLQVSVTKASGDYGVDVVANLGEKKYAFQCKCYSSNIGVKSVQEVFSGAKMYNADVAVVITNSYFTANAQKLASELKVQLWNRDELSHLIRHVENQGNASSKNGLIHTFGVRETNIRSKGGRETHEVEQNIPSARLVIGGATISSAQITTEASKLGVNKEINVSKNNLKEMAEMSTILGAGTYYFGKNIPNGNYDLFAKQGYGLITRYDLEGEELSTILFGVDKGYAKEYRGMSSDDFMKFEVEGNVEFEIKKSQMIEIE